MERSFGPITSSISPSKKALARVALVDVKDPVRGILGDCFRQFGVDCILVSGDAPQRLQREKFDACVVKLSPAAEPVMLSARTSPSNSRMVIYGLGGSARDALQFSKYGVNAVFHEPLERPAALKLVRATQMLVLHEFRRYVRIPVITEVAVIAGDGRRFSSTSQEISSGGMSLRSTEDISSGMGIEISFALLTLPRIWVKGQVTWLKPHNKTFGMRFDPQDDRRLRIKEWVEGYLEG